MTLIEMELKPKNSVQGLGLGAKRDGASEKRFFFYFSLCHLFDCQVDENMHLGVKNVILDDTICRVYQIYFAKPLKLSDKTFKLLL